jgi:hypothetical protein
MSIFAGARTDLPKTADTHLPSDDMRAWPTIKLEPDLAAAYLEGEIYEWFWERGIDKRAEIEQEKRVRTQAVSLAWQGISNILQGLPKHRPHVPWYLGGINGVRADRAIRWQIKSVHEEFRDNPYGLGGLMYWLLLFSMLVFMVGNIAIGAVDGSSQNPSSRWSVLRPMLQGAINGIPVIWVMTTFLFPALIANRKEQYAVHGHLVDD